MITGITVCLAIAFSSSAKERGVTQLTCDKVTYEIVQHDEWTHQVRQLTFWDWCPEYKRWHCQGWHIVLRDEDFTVRKSGKTSVVKFGKIQVICGIFNTEYRKRFGCMQNAEIFPTKYRRKDFGSMWQNYRGMVVDD